LKLEVELWTRIARVVNQIKGVVATVVVVGDGIVEPCALSEAVDGKPRFV
jgi:hypothetical protein